jgi:hypothetical protein
MRTWLSPKGFEDVEVYDYLTLRAYKYIDTYSQSADDR